MAGPAPGPCEAVRTEPLPVAFYERPTLQVARDLLGCVITHTTATGVVAAMIVETEAYVGLDDAASHASAGRTRRNAPMWGPPGRSYVYRSYGLHWLLNAVTEREGYPAAVLLRAAAPLAGGAVLAERCHGQPPATWLVGPGRLTRGLDVDGACNDQPLTAGPLRIGAGVLVPDADVQVSGRVGVSRAAGRPWRFFLRDHPRVSARSVRGRPLACHGGLAGLYSREED